MSRDTTVADRTASFEEAFAEAPRAELPATIQQQVIDERPRGAISVHVKRDELEILRKIKVIASAAGDDFFYSWPTKNKDGTKGVVEGPSVKCANAVARIFGNCSVKVRVFDMGATWIFYAQFYDLETGFVLERPFQQRKGQNVGGGMDKDRAADIVFQIGQSKAIRNVVCNALRPFTDFAFDEAKKSLVARIERDPVKYRKAAADALAAANITADRVERVLGRTVDQWTPADIARVRAELQSVRDGWIPAEDLWPMVAADQRPTRDQFTEGGASDQGGNLNTSGPKPSSAGESTLAQKAKEVAAQEPGQGTQGTPATEGAAAPGGDQPPSQAAQGGQAAETGAGAGMGGNGGTPAPSPAQEGDQSAAGTTGQPAATATSGPDTAQGAGKPEEEDQAAKHGAEMLGKVKGTIAEGTFDTEMGVDAYAQRMKVAIAGIPGMRPDLEDDLKGQLARLVIEEKQRLAKKKGKRK